MHTPQEQDIAALIELIKEVKTSVFIMQARRLAHQSILPPLKRSESPEIGDGDKGSKTSPVQSGSPIHSPVKNRDELFRAVYPASALTAVPPSACVAPSSPIRPKTSFFTPPHSPSSPPRNRAYSTPRSPGSYSKIGPS